MARRPSIEVAVGRVAVGPGGLEPGMVDRGVVHDQVGDHPDPPLPGRAQELHHVAQAAQPRVDAVVVGDVVAVVPVRGRVERHQPQAGDPEPGQVVDPVGQPGEVADPVAVAVGEQLDVQAVDHRVLPPQVAGRLVAHRPALPAGAAAVAAARAGSTSAPNSSMVGRWSRPTSWTKTPSKPSSA